MCRVNPQWPILHAWKNSVTSTNDVTELRTFPLPKIRNNKLEWNKKNIDIDTLTDSFAARKVEKAQTVPRNGDDDLATVKEVKMYLQSINAFVFSENIFQSFIMFAIDSKILLYSWTKSDKIRSNKVCTSENNTIKLMIACLLTVAEVVDKSVEHRLKLSKFWPLSDYHNLKPSRGSFSLGQETITFYVFFEI